MPYVAREDGIKIYYESHGSGHPIVFIHGGNGNTLSWINQIPFFSKSYRCIAIDMRTFKNSQCQADQYHAKDLPYDLLAVLDDAAVSQAALVCQSSGAWAGLPIAVRHPSRVSAIVINGSPTPVYSERNWALLARATPIVQAVQRGELPKAKATGISERFIQQEPALTFLYEAIGQLNGSRRTETMTDEACKIYPDDLEEYSRPTLIMGGKHDHFLEPDHHLHIASLIPGAKTYTFENSGHSAYWEEPTEYNRVVASFLAANGW